VQHAALLGCRQDFPIAAAQPAPDRRKLACGFHRVDSCGCPAHCIERVTFEPINVK
jgi:hypothetical protein